MFAEILEVLGPLRTEGRRILFPTAFHAATERERKRSEKKRARLPPVCHHRQEELIRDLAAHKSGPPTAEGLHDTKGGN